MRTATVVAVLTSSALLLACSGDDDATDAPGGATSDSGDSSSVTVPDRSAGTQATAAAETAETAGTAATPSSDAPTTTFAVVEVPESGVPGLDSVDSFCAAWSRFGGSWQVIQVAANFAPDPAVVPAMEIVASPIVLDAYDAMFDVWPTELGPERDVVADGYFGPLQRRAEAAMDSLDRVGASAEQIDALGAAWVDALAARRTDEPTVTPELSDELRSLVDAAAAELVAERVDFLDDPSMRITVSTPLTDVYLSTACPDQGSLTGGEVDGG